MSSNWKFYLYISPCTESINFFMGFPLAPILSLFWGFYFLPFICDDSITSIFFALLLPQLHSSLICLIVLFIFPSSQSSPIVHLCWYLTTSFNVCSYVSAPNRIILLKGLLLHCFYCIYNKLVEEYRKFSLNANYNTVKYMMNDKKIYILIGIWLERWSFHYLGLIMELDGYFKTHIQKRFVINIQTKEQC